MPSAPNIAFPNLCTGPTRPATYPITASQTFRPGDLVYLTTSGLVSIAATADADVGNIKILGLSLTDATWALEKGYDAEVAIPLSGFRFLTQLYHSTWASATLAVADIDAPRDLPIRNAGGRWMLNVETDATNDRAYVIERHNRYAVTEAGSWWWAGFLESGLLFGGQ